MHRGEHDLFLGRFARRKFFDDAPSPEDQDPVGQIHDLRQIGGDHDYGQAFVGDAIDQFIPRLWTALRDSALL
jgi:hypothetical protein